MTKMTGGEALAKSLYGISRTRARSSKRKRRHRHCILCIIANISNLRPD